MKIFNIRTCFANNSSSSHSIIFIPKEDVGTINDRYDGGQEFGWGDFTLASVSSKNDYFKQILYGNLYPVAGEDQAREIAEGFFQSEINTEGYVDHQSFITLPRNYEGTSVNLDFFKEYYNHVVNNDQIVILGGNDNSDGHPLEDTYPTDELSNYLPTEDSRYSLIAHKMDNYWILFNKYNGYKTRFSFDESVNKPTKSSIPELVDLKITDFCPFNCEFCYQGSTISGRHASLQSIKAIIDELSDKKVLELAMGGGEPTMHPNFLEILEYAQSKHLVANFTTKSSQWFKNKDIRSAILNNSNSFAYSAVNFKELKEFHELTREYNKSLTNYKDRRIDFAVQVVLETLPKEEFIEILKYCCEYGIKIVLLGFKSTERGERYNRMDDYYWLFQTIKELQITNIGMDTIAIQQYEQELKLMEINDVFYSAKDGAFSCYIDAVENKIAPNSYCDKSEYSNFDHNWIQTYRGY